MAAKNEYNILQKLDHKNIVRVKDFIITDVEIFMIMEYIKGEELLNRISEIQKYDEMVARKLFKQLLKALKYLKDQGVCHRDIKPSNILVCNDKDQIKLTDFNISKKCENNEFKMLTMIGTEGFKAPELYNQYTYYNEKVDMWAAGCVLYTMLSGYMPFFEEK